MNRAAMSPEERKSRSEAVRLVAEEGLIHGTLQVRERVCGKPRCRCLKGQKHRSLYLILREAGGLRQACVPREQEGVVRAWVENHRRLRELTEEVSRRCVERIRSGRG